jgi:S1-C subfamily serine protease
VQISAPISPGSSGGGVFDGAGNLIGITTFHLRDTQNLNFAIAADAYWASR